jgi:hypothetical protein
VAVVLERTSPAWDPSAPSFLIGFTDFNEPVPGPGVRRFDAALEVPSSAHGDWRVAAVVFDATVEEDIDPADAGLSATMTVSGSHMPRLRVSVAPSPLPYPKKDATVTARYTFADTGAPIARKPVAFGSVGVCDGASLPTIRTTDSAGVAKWATRYGYPVTLCAWAPLPSDAADGFLAHYADLRWISTVGVKLTAVANHSTVRAGRSTFISGAALTAVVRTPAATRGATLRFQRLVNRTWTPVSSLTVGDNGRYKVTVTVPRGRTSYRLVMLARTGLAQAVSPTVVITGN